MAWFVSAVLLLAGVGMLVSSSRADRVVRRGQHTQGHIVSASKAWIDESGRRLWDVQVSFRADAGQEVSVSVRQAGNDVDRRVGEPVDVWFDPHRPEHAVAILGENSSQSSAWPLYVIALALLLGGAGVLAAQIR